MQERRNNFLAILLGLWLLPWLLGAAAAELEIQVLSLTDTHGAVRSGAENAGRGGWLRLASLIRRERAAFGAERTLLIDCGDTLQGGFEAAASRGRIGVEFLAGIGVDVWVPGNHDLEFGLGEFRAAVDRLGARVLAGNLALPEDASRRLEPLPAWRLFERNGIRVAVIGATAKHLDLWLWGDAVAGYRVESAAALLARVLPAVHRARPDVIVLALHQGWQFSDPRQVNEVAALVKRYPELDLVLGGHTHQLHPGERIGPRTWYVQSGFGADWLGRTRLRFDAATRTVLDLRSELLPVTAELPEDPVLKGRLRPFLAAADRAAREPAGSLAAPVRAAGVPGQGCESSELLCEALAWATGADAVLHGKLNEASLPAGPLTRRDLFFLVPYENSVALASVTVAELKRILAEQRRTAAGTTAFNGLWGVVAELGPDGEVRRLTRADGAPLADSDRLTLALNGYVVAGAGGRFPELRAILRQPAARLQDTGQNTREALRQFLVRHPGWRPAPRRWLRRLPEG